MARASIAYELLLLLNGVSTAIDKRTRLDGMDIVDATTGGIFLDELDTHGG